MILPSGHSNDYLVDYKDGKIQKGLGLGISFDENLLFKRRQLNIILGHDNVGKSYWFEWYMLALSSQHDLKWTVWMGENSAGQVMRDLIQMYSGKHFKDLTYNEIRKYAMKIEYWFTFVSNEKLYKPKELLDIFDSTNADGCFIDPFTGLDRGMTHADNYEFLNTTRQFCNQTNKTVYVSTHPTSESGRTSMLYPDGHMWKGHLRAPMKAHVEGGKPFLNRCDDMIVIHRLVKHQDMKYSTMIDVEKIKDRDTGGQQTALNEPILFEFNNGLGFKLGGIDAIKRANKENEQTSLSAPNYPPPVNFYEAGRKENEDEFNPAEDEDCPF
jgi:hypothetical protein